MPAAKSDEQVLAEHSRPLPSGCVEWTGKITKDGYGQTFRNSVRFGRIHLAHRLAYMLKFGPIPIGMEIDHRCRLRRCVNPEHFELVTHSTNVARAVRVRENHANARKLDCKRGHPLSGSNLAIETYGGITMRKCRECRAQRKDAREARLRCTSPCPLCLGEKSPRSHRCRTCYLDARRQNKEMR